MSTARRIRGENRFYNPPAIRKLQQERERKRLEEQEAQEKKKATKEITLDRQKKEEEKRPLPSPDECSTSDCSVPGRTSTKGWRTRGQEFCSYFLLNDLWDSFEEWSAYGVGVPLLLNGVDSVVQYYVPYLSGIQLYEDPSRRASASRKRAGEESDGDSSRDMSTNGCRVSLEEKPCFGSSSDESEDSPGDLVFEYLEAAMPLGREPLTDKAIQTLCFFPALKTYRSCDLSPSSWVFVAWFPIYRIPLGQSLQNLDACFLTFHSLSTPSRGTSSNENSQSSNKSVAPSKKVTLPTFGLASYKFKMYVWSRESDVEENQRVVALLREAEEWLRRLKVMLPNFKHFVTHSGGSAWR
uniref:Uncharacterized protein n=1 Tax=Brassica campestris TaxID=3711 RepID=A0A3P5ZRG1_BRACM|nr:unnamed protein product [Brassica rapa]